MMESKISNDDTIDNQNQKKINNELPILNASQHNEVLSRVPQDDPPNKISPINVSKKRKFDGGDDDDEIEFKKFKKQRIGQSKQRAADYYERIILKQKAKSAQKLQQHEGSNEDEESGSTEDDEDENSLEGSESDNSSLELEELDDITDQKKLSPAKQKMLLSKKRAREVARKKGWISKTTTGYTPSESSSDGDSSNNNTESSPIDNVEEKTKAAKNYNYEQSNTLKNTAKNDTSSLKNNFTFTGQIPLTSSPSIFLPKPKTNLTQSKFSLQSPQTVGGPTLLPTTTTFGATSDKSFPPTNPKFSQSSTIPTKQESINQQFTFNKELPKGQSRQFNNISQTSIGQEQKQSNFFSQPTSILPPAQTPLSSQILKSSVGGTVHSNTSAFKNRTPVNQGNLSPPSSGLRYRGSNDRSTHPYQTFSQPSPTINLPRSQVNQSSISRKGLFFSIVLLALFIGSISFYTMSYYNSNVCFSDSPGLKSELIAIHNCERFIGCPRHALCKNGGIIGCNEPFSLTENKQECILYPSLERALKVVIKTIRDLTVKDICNNIWNIDYSTYKAPGISINVLESILPMKMKISSISNLPSALQQFVDIDDSTNVLNGHTLIRLNDEEVSLLNLPLSCAIQNYFNQNFLSSFVLIGSVIFAIILIPTFRKWFVGDHEQLATLFLTSRGILINANHSLSRSQVRDAVLSRVYPNSTLQQREKFNQLWPKVEIMLKSNPRVKVLNESNETEQIEPYFEWMSPSKHPNMLSQQNINTN